MIGLKRLLSYARIACDYYNMIEEGDVVAVGVSAGKDSLSLLYTLSALLRFYPKKFKLIAITVDMEFDELGGGRPKADYTPIANLCKELGVEYFVEESHIAKIVFDIRKEKSPCSLCAKLRRGALNEAEKRLGANKVALGHHFDDAVQTFMLNLFYEGRIGCFSPVTYLDRTDITVIRPLVYAPEKDVEYFARHTELPVIESSCPANKNTEREEMKTLLSELERNNRGLRHRIFGAMLRSGVSGFKESKIKTYDDEE